MHSDPTISIRTRILTDGSKVFDIILEQDEHQIILGIYIGTTNPTAAAHRAANALADAIELHTMEAVTRAYQ
jgi:hypothetical protein